MLKMFCGKNHYDNPSLFCVKAHALKLKKLKTYKK